jgi:hypothetical protein
VNIFWEIIQKNFGEFLGMKPGNFPGTYAGKPVSLPEKFSENFLKIQRIHCR